MKTDTLFYNLFQLFPKLLFELIGADPSQSTKYEFSSREVKEVARRFDGLLIPNSNEFSDLIYFVEVQFQGKEDFYWRLFGEIAAYLAQYQPPNDCQAVAIFASRNLEPEFPAQYRYLRPQLRVVYLDEITKDENLPISLGIVKLILTSPEKVKERFPKLVEQVEQIHDRTLEQKILDFIETVLFYKFTNMSREEVAAMFSLDDIRGTKLYQELYEEAKVEGKAEGKAEGELLGEAKGKLEAIRGLLTLGLGVEQIAQALGVERSIVERVAGGEVVTPESFLRK